MKQHVPEMAVRADVKIAKGTVYHVRYVEIAARERDQPNSDNYGQHTFRELQRCHRP